MNGYGEWKAALVAVALLGGTIGNTAMSTSELPVGTAPEPVSCPHFPSRFHAFVWRNWHLLPVNRLAAAVDTSPDNVRRTAEAMGLGGQPAISADFLRRSTLTVIRRNWHLLPYAQLLRLLDWTPEQMAFTLREEDFLYHKLGRLKPKCAPVVCPEATAAIREAEARVAAEVKQYFPEGVGSVEEPLFGFVRELSALPGKAAGGDRGAPREGGFTPRFCYSYFALYGDPLLDPTADPFPDGYLARLAQCGVDGVWLQAVLYTLTPFPWDPARSRRWEDRLATLRLFAERLKRRGMKLYLYLNEPRAMPLSFFDQHPQLKGVTEEDHATLCTSVPEVREYLVESIARICDAVPELGGFFSITASENLTNCWSHHRGEGCSRCGQRSPEEVIAEVNQCFYKGIRKAGGTADLIVWDWGWNDAWAPGIIQRLPKEAALMSVSEWSIPIRRGGIDSICGEYSISTVGPGPRARRHWELAKARGMRTMAKIQANTTWEIGAVPFVPAVANVARHAANLRHEGVNGLMLSWTLGGCPSANLDVVAEIGAAGADGTAIDPEAAMAAVAGRRFGDRLAPAAVAAWQAFSAAFSEFPFHIQLVYRGPQHLGPANLLWAEPTGYAATMVGFPYDDLDGWRAVYPPDVFIGQFDKIATGFEQAIGTCRQTMRAGGDSGDAAGAAALAEDLRIAQAVAVHCRSGANQARFVLARDRLAAATERVDAEAAIRTLESVLRGERDLALRLYRLQGQDSRIGFEASNHYFYIPADLAEKVLNCQDLLRRWLPDRRRAWGLP